ncbi:hypothetical protein HYFRA_00004761 [Hymenoscyphus fraxineus]|uniref:Uncharacterized protein n=1 Tax=Hymenoscyphus fraxineus TaxID=746836 RepID=A0A9N9KK48_9HELO|nr:hypothetical protein HYFRA_00004761 [Hymenoscyphus fraxineus]
MSRPIKMLYPLRMHELPLECEITLMIIMLCQKFDIISCPHTQTQYIKVANTLKKRVQKAPSPGPNREQICTIVCNYLTTELHLADGDVLEENTSSNNHTTKKTSGIKNLDRGNEKIAAPTINVVLGKGTSSDHPSAPSKKPRQHIPESVPSTRTEKNLQVIELFDDSDEASGGGNRNHLNRSQLNFSGTSIPAIPITPTPASTTSVPATLDQATGASIYDTIVIPEECHDNEAPNDNDTALTPQNAPLTVWAQKPSTVFPWAREDNKALNDDNPAPTPQNAPLPVWAQKPSVLFPWASDNNNGAPIAPLQTSTPAASGQNTTYDDKEDFLRNIRTDLRSWELHPFVDYSWAFNRFAERYASHTPRLLTQDITREGDIKTNGILCLVQYLSNLKVR